MWNCELRSASRPEQVADEETGRKGSTIQTTLYKPRPEEVANEETGRKGSAIRITIHNQGPVGDIDGSLRS